MNRDDVMNIFSNIIKTYNENNIGLKGMNLGFFSLYLNKLLKETDNGIIVVTPTIYEANKLYQNFSDTKDVFLYETDDVLTSLATSKSPELKVEKLNILKESLNNNKKIIITDINGYLKKLPSINDFKNNIIIMRKEDVFHDEISSKIRKGINASSSRTSNMRTFNGYRLRFMSCNNAGW